PMPYGDLSSSEVQRFASRDDLEQADVTIEEREEYEKHIDNNHIVFAGIDYQTILSSAESEGDIIVWDGGNNELPFIEPTVHFVLADPLRASDTLSYHPGETNLRMADYVLINKENSASQNNINTVVSDVNEVNASATILHADSIVEVDNPSQIRNNDVLVVEDGPTVTHGNANYGAGTIAARKYDANKRIDPQGAAVGSIQQVLAEYDQLDRILPAMGYSSKQIEDLSKTIANVDCDVVIAGTPIDLQEIIDIDKQIVQAEYTVSVHDRSFQDVLQSHADVLTLNNVSQ
ncbi:MAG: GTPase, partial [Halobacteriaceae archaeon]